MKEKKSEVKHAAKESPAKKFSAKGIATSEVKKVAAKKTIKSKVAKEAKEKPALKLVSLANLKRPFGSHKKRKYLGRGSSSGHGKTSTRGSRARWAPGNV